jgi:GTPase-associated protein 1
MAGELVYTSVPKGLNKGESGFCVVARSASIPPMLLNRLAALSGYKEMISAIDPQANDNPVNFANTLIDCGNERFTVISRVGFAGLDYTGRSNKIADHLILTEDEVAGAGPGELLAIQELFYTSWNKPSLLLPENAKLIPQKPVAVTHADYWERITGKSDWAEHLIELSRRNSDKPIYIITRLGVDNLALVKEALRLLPIHEQWQYTFSTYCSSNIRGINYRWRFIYPGTDIYDKIKNRSNTVKFDLSKLPEKIYSAGLSSGENTAPGKPLRIGASMATIVPERYRFEPNANQVDEQPHRSIKQRQLITIIAGCSVVLLIVLLLYVFFGRQDTAAIKPVPGNSLKPPVPNVAVKPPVQNGAATTTGNEQLKRKTVVDIPLLIVLDKHERAEVKLRTPLHQTVKQALAGDHKTSLTIELQFIMKQQAVKMLAGKHNVEFNRQAVTGSGSIVLNDEEALKAAINDLADTIDSSAFVKHSGHEANNMLMNKIKSILAKPSSSGNKNFYENSAEYLLGELVPEFRQRYMAFDIGRAGMFSNKRKLQRKIIIAKTVVSKYRAELRDSGMERDRKLAITNKLKSATQTVSILQDEYTQLVTSLKRLKLPDNLMVYREALLRAFFCFGKNYMVDAEKIIGFNHSTADVKYLKTVIKKTNIAQQLSYENEFKAELDGYIYRRTMQKIISDAQTQLEKLRMRLEYNRPDRLFNLIIEDNNHEKP